MNKSVSTTIITILIGLILLLCYKGNSDYTIAHSYYQVYLHGEVIGVIEDADALYEVIDTNQTSIKNEYDVESVYPPTDLEIVSINTYDDAVDDIEDVYEKIEAEDNFTIKGYIITIFSDDAEDITINVLDEAIFEEALINFVNSFLDDGEYSAYINNEQEEITDTGSIINSMYFDESITIKEAYISVDEYIYTDVTELTQYLLFGPDPEMEYYTVELGDTLESIADEYKLGVSDLLTINPSYKSENVILQVGSTLNVSYIDPVLTFVYEMRRISIQEIAYETTVEKDNTKSYTYSEITTPGVNGEQKITEVFTVSNGEQSQDSVIEDYEIIKEPVTQVTVKGTLYSSGTYVDIGGSWGWPTNRPYTITSYYGYRWGRLHAGIDISGTGFGSPIYAVASGTVTYVLKSCPDKGSGYYDTTCSSSLGNYVVIDHGNGYYTTYGHMRNNITVSVGTTVSRGEVIGYMGSSGSSTGTHLHFAVGKGTSTNYFNPLSLYQ